MSLRVGPLVGPVVGPKVAPNGDVSSGVTWTVDATSGKACPADSTEWAALIASLGLTGVVAVPNSVWLCQETSGDLADSVGLLTLPDVGSPLYDQSVTGWARKGVGFDVGSTDAFAAGAGVGPDPSATSSRWLWFALVTTPATTRRLMSVGGAAGTTDFALEVTSTPRPQVNLMATTAVGGAAPDGLASLLYDRTNSLSVGYTDTEKISITYNAGVTDGVKGIGGGVVAAVAASVVYGCMWHGAEAEFAEASYRTLLEGMGWGIGW